MWTKIKIEKKTITAKTRKLSGQWTYNGGDDLIEKRVAKMKSTHTHQILEHSESTHLTLVKHRGLNNKKWYEIRMAGEYLWTRDGIRTAEILRKLYGTRTVKFKRLAEANKAYLWVLLNRE